MLVLEAGEANEGEFSDISLRTSGTRKLTLPGRALESISRRIAGTANAVTREWGIAKVIGDPARAGHSLASEMLSGEFAMSDSPSALSMASSSTPGPDSDFSCTSARK